MTRRVFRYEVPVDDQPHEFKLLSNAEILHVAAVAVDLVEFWIEDYGDAVRLTARRFQVFGTGQDLPDQAKWVGTCDRTDFSLMWHLYEVTR